MCMRMRVSAGMLACVYMCACMCMYMYVYVRVLECACAHPPASPRVAHVGAGTVTLSALRGVAAQKGAHPVYTLAFPVLLAAPLHRASRDYCCIVYRYIY